MRLYTRTTPSMSWPESRSASGASGLTMDSVFFFRGRHMVKGVREGNEGSGRVVGSWVRTASPGQDERPRQDARVEKKRRCGARTNGDGDVRLRDLLFPQPSVQVRGDPDRSQRAALGEDVLRVEHRALGCRDARVGCHDSRWESATRRISRIPGTRGRARRSASRAFARTARALAERAGDAPSVRSRAERSGTRACKCLGASEGISRLPKQRLYAV